MKGLTRQISVLIATIATLAVNYASVLFRIGGLSTGEVADLYKIKFYPAGYAFSIWGIIYLALAVFTVWQMLPAQRNNEKLDRIGMYYIYTSIGNITWIFLWQYQYPVLSIIPIVFMLVTLLASYKEIMTDTKPGEKWVLGVPFSLYTGWISVATIACISAGLYSLGWNG
ncbi:MAG: tryptophan-rich sensory protein, partial [Caldiserica bacterium]|nr:tryptophan-rich sensory protein [Caldisericota bacterium]